MVSSPGRGSAAQASSVNFELRLPRSARDIALPRRANVRAARFVRKHAVFLTALVLFHVVMFFPTLFMGRVLSANDVLFNHAPWSLTPHDPVQNDFLDSEATGILPALRRVHVPGAMHWDESIAAGVTGWGASAVASPFFFLPALLPIALTYAGIILLKANFAAIFGYLWLRQERLGRAPAAAGAMVIALAGSYSVWWLRHPTNATVLYPAMFWVASRVLRSRPVSPLLVGFIGFCAATSGFPAMAVYVAYPLAAYGVWRFARGSRPSLRALAPTASALVLSLLIAAPLYVPFFQFLRSTGYLETRENWGAEHFYPVSHLASFLNPNRLGHPADRNWRGDPGLGYSNDLVEAAVYVGLITLPLVVAGLFRRRSRDRWFWVAVLIALLFVLFTRTRLGLPVDQLPGIRYSPLTRLRVLLPLPVAYLAASGVGLMLSLLARRKRVMAVAAVAIAAIVTVDLTLFAAHFHSYLRFGDSGISRSRAMELFAAGGPFRVAPFLTWAPPNTAQMLGFEDVRSHFNSQRLYRSIMLRIDPSVWDSPTRLLLNPLKIDPTDPLLAFLNVRYFVEQPNVDVTRWRVMEQVHPLFREGAAVQMAPGQAVEREIETSDAIFQAAEIPISADGSAAEQSGVNIVLTRPETGERLYEVFYAAAELKRLPKVYVPVASYAGPWNRLLLRIEARGTVVNLVGEEGATDLNRFVYRRVATPMIIQHEWDDARVLLNVAEKPRWFSSWSVDVRPFAEVLRDRSVDFSRTAVVEGATGLAGRLAAVAPFERSSHISILEYAPHEQTVEVRTRVPLLLASSEKISPHLRLRLNGREVEPLTVNGLFAGLELPPGTHTIELERRIGRGLWIPAALGLLGLGVLQYLVGRRRVTAAF